MKCTAPVVLSAAATVTHQSLLLWCRGIFTERSSSSNFTPAGWPPDF